MLEKVESLRFLCFLRFAIKHECFYMIESVMN